MDNSSYNLLFLFISISLNFIKSYLSTVSIVGWGKRENNDPFPLSEVTEGHLMVTVSCKSQIRGYIERLGSIESSAKPLR